MTFADAAEAWLVHGERKRNLKRLTLKDYRHALNAYLLPADIQIRSRETSLSGQALRELDDGQESTLLGVNASPPDRNGVFYPPSVQPR